jgi:2-keto-3-deoxy-galactonokinase
MTNEERNIIIADWGDTTLRIKLDDNPYGLTPDEVRSLQVNDSLNNLLLSGLSADAGELPVF